MSFRFPDREDRRNIIAQSCWAQVGECGGRLRAWPDTAAHSTIDGTYDPRGGMPLNRSVAGLCFVIAILAVIVAGVGLFWGGDGDRVEFETPRGDTVRLYGEGLYRYDTVFMGSGNRGVDGAILLFGVPLLIAALLVYVRAPRRGGLLLLAPLAYLLYAYASIAFGAAYNVLFLPYVVLLGASLFAFVTLLAEVLAAGPPEASLERLPRRGLAGFLFVGAMLTLFVWGEPLVSGLVRNRPPLLLDSYTTMVTYALDLAVITPATFLAAALVLRRRWLGYVIAVPLLGILALLLPQIIAQTLSQLRAGVELSPAQIVGPVAGFAILGGAAVVFLGAILARLGRR